MDQHQTKVGATLSQNRRQEGMAKTLDTTQQNSTIPSNSYFSMDVLMMGGASILASGLFWLAVNRGNSLHEIAYIAYALAFIVNHPHFLSSYVLLYGDFKKRVFTHIRYFWAAVIVPILLLGLLGYALLTTNQQIMAHVITSMFFFVGWHYIKQVFGCVIVTSAQRKMFYTQNERRLMLSNLFAVWVMSWLHNQVEVPGTNASAAFSFYGISHYRMNLPEWTLLATWIVLGLSAVAVIAMHVRRYIDTGVKPSAPGVAAYVSLYVWYVPTMIHPAFGYFIPLFHSLQYLAFVYVLKSNQVRSEIRGIIDDRERRKKWLSRFCGFFANATILGALAFEFVPKYLDGQNLLLGMGTSPFMAAFLLFINIHHYFIDNVIWRSDNPTVREHLFQTSSNLQPQKKSDSAIAA